jgi:hypothetical protein
MWGRLDKTAMHRLSIFGHRKVKRMTLANILILMMIVSYLNCGIKKPKLGYNPPVIFIARAHMWGNRYGEKACIQ